MRIFISFFFTLFFSASAFSQAQQSIIGKWKVVSVEDREITMDFIKDSLSIIDELQSEYPTEAEIQHKKIAMKKEFGNLQFVFAPDNAFQILDGGKIKMSGTCQFNASQKTIVKLLYKDQAGTQIIEECPFFDISPYLLFSMKGNTLKFMLEKIK